MRHIAFVIDHAYDGKKVIAYLRGEAKLSARLVNSLKKIEKGIRLMQRNFKDSRLSVSILSESCGVSESYFRRVYRQTYGISPWRAIQNSRYQHACNLLRSGYYSPKQAAELSGFTDVKYIPPEFKKQFGITPTEYIKNR